MLYLKSKLCLSAFPRVACWSMLGTFKTFSPYACTTLRTYSRWTTKEKELLAQRIEQGVPRSSIAAELNRTEDAIRQRLNRKPRAKKSRRREEAEPWSRSDLEKISLARQLTPPTTWTDIVKEYPDRTPQSARLAFHAHCRNEAASLTPGAHKRWTTEDVEELLSLHAKAVPKTEICQRLQRTLSAVNVKLRQCKGGVARARREWSATEDEVLLRECRRGVSGSYRRAAALLPGRTIMAATFRWHYYLRDKVQDLQVEATVLSSTEATSK